MSEYSESDRTAAEQRRGGTPEDAAQDAAVEGDVADGQYVEGDYGAAGTAGENPAAAVEGEYSAGDYGDAGVAGAASAVGDDEGEYTEGDYGEAGVVGATVTAIEDGDYPEGDYGAAGPAGAQRTDRRVNGEPGYPAREDES
jgi:hypothetical protein